MKKCSVCQEARPADEFYKDKSKKDGLASTCKTCSKERLRKWRRGELTPRQSVPREDTRLFRRTYLNDIRAIPCTDCKGIFPSVCMDFDHLPQYEKKFTIMTEYWWRVWEEVLAEVAKCEVVCANCHRIRTWMRRVV